MKSKKIIILVVSIVVLFLIIIGGYIGYKFYNITDERLCIISITYNFIR